MIETGSVLSKYNQAVIMSKTQEERNYCLCQEEYKSVNGHGQPRENRHWAAQKASSVRG